MAKMSEILKIKMCLTTMVSEAAKVAKVGDENMKKGETKNVLLNTFKLARFVMVKSR